MLRKYQVEMIDALRAAIKAGNRRVILVAPTGAGKGTIASQGIAAPAAARGHRVLAIAGRLELINQLAERMPPGSAGIIKAGIKPDRDHLIQVASVQTLVRRTYPPADIVITDECHLANAPTYRRIYAEYPDAIHCGLTASPYRANGCGLGTDFWQAIVSTVDVPTLTAAGHLVPVRTFAPSRPDLSGVHTKGGDYETGELAARVAPLVGDIVKTYLKLAAGRQTICFAVNVEHSKELAAQFLAAGVPAEHVDGETDAAVRAAALARLASGETMVVCNCGLFSTGVDVPPVSCVILACPTKSRVKWRQTAGRGMRPHPGKESCLLLDHANCSEMHGLISDVEDYTLADDKRAGPGDDSGPPIRTCPACFAVILSSAQVCSECGQAMPASVTRQVQTADGELAEVGKSAPKVVRFRMAEHAALLEMAATARAKGYAAGWIGHQFQKRFGRWPAGMQQLTSLLRGDPS